MSHLPNENCDENNIQEPTSSIVFPEIFAVDNASEHSQSSSTTVKIYLARLQPFNQVCPHYNIVEVLIS